MQGFSNLSEVRARGLLNLGKKAFGPSELRKFDAVKFAKSHLKDLNSETIKAVPLPEGFSRLIFLW